MGSAACNQQRDIFKTCRQCLCDSNMIVRSATARVIVKFSIVSSVAMTIPFLNTAVYVGSHDAFIQYSRT